MKFAVRTLNNSVKGYVEGSYRMPKHVFGGSARDTYYRLLAADKLELFAKYLLVANDTVATL